MIGERLSQVRAQWERLSLRERRLMTLFGACLCGLVVFSIGYIIADGLRNIEEHNRTMRQALRDIENHRDEYQRAKAESDVWGMRIPAEDQGQPLQGYLEAAAKDLDITIPEMNERPAVPKGKRFVEKSVDIKLRGVNLQQLAEFLRKVETTSQHIVVVSRLLVRTRFGQHDQLDVEMTVSTFERTTPEKGKPHTKTMRGEKS